MTSQLARLQQLEKKLRAATASASADSPAIAYARQWVVDHDVDPALLDLWLADEMVDTDLRTYTVLMGAMFETWLTLEVHLPVHSDTLWCDRINEMTAAEPPQCDCEPPCGPTCARDTEWLDYRNDAYRRGYPMIVYLDDIPGLPERPVTRTRR